MWLNAHIEELGSYILFENPFTKTINDVKNDILAFMED